MFTNTHIGFIGGGNMGGALIKGLVGTSLVPPEQIHLYDVDKARVRELVDDYRIQPDTGIAELAHAVQIVILAVKPQVMADVLNDLKNHLDHRPLVISIAAGVPIQTIADALPSDISVIRVMPNTPALVLQGASALARGAHVSDQQMKQALALFEAVGIAIEVEEKAMDAVTGLSGSGPAYLLLLLESLMDAGVLMGLARPVARKLVIQTVLGTAKMIAEMDSHPAALKDMITSPGGTTIYGLQVLENAGVRGALMDAVQAATIRSRALGKAKA